MCGHVQIDVVDDRESGDSLQVNMAFDKESTGVC